jgi:beta-lactamase class A
MNADAHSPMQSVYKLPITMAVLKRVDEGRLRLDQKIRLEAVDLPPKRIYSPLRDKYPRGGVELALEDLLRAAIVDSDSAASDRLLRLVSAAEVNSYLQSLGISDLVVLNKEKEMAADHQAQYRNWTTPAAAVELLKQLQEGKALSTASRELVLSWMTATQTGIRRSRALLPKGAVVADKTGTSGTLNGVAPATNDIAIVTLPNGKHMLIAVFVSDAKADQVTREAVIAKIVRATWDCWAE